MILARVYSEFQMVINNEIIINSCRISIRYVGKTVKKEHTFANLQTPVQTPACE